MADRAPIRRTAALVIGVLAVQVAFVLSYVGALHKPGAHHIPVAVVGSPRVAAAAEPLLAGQPGAFDVRRLDTVAAATDAIHHRKIYAALIPNQTGKTDRLLTSSAASTAVDQLVRQRLGAAEAARHRSLSVDDIVPVQRSDPRGLAGFYLAVGWVVGGYLVAALIGLLRGARPPNRPLALTRVGALLAFAIGGGALTSIFVGPVFGWINGHPFGLAVAGALTIFAVAVFTAGLQALLGLVGIGIAILAFVVLGNPSSGGPYATEMLPVLWRTVGPWLPPGAGTTLVRTVVYFHHHATRQAILVLVGYVILGLALFFSASWFGTRRSPTHRRHEASTPPPPAQDVDDGSPSAA